MFIFLALLSYVSYWLYSTITPFFEGDDGFVLAGIAGLIKKMEGISLYRENIQPLYENLFKGIYHLLPGLPLNFLPALANTVSVLCLVVSLFLLYFGAKRLTSRKFARCFITACLLIPEIIISAAYPNSSILAFFFLCLAFYILSLPDNPNIICPASGIAMVLAFYARVDAIWIFPCFLSAAYCKKGRLKDVIFSVIVMAVVWIYFMKTFRLDISLIMHQARQHYAIFSLPLNAALINLLSALPVAIILSAVIGLSRVIARRRWLTVLLFGIGVLPLCVFYMRAFTTPKYWLYLYPFIAWLAVEGWLALSELRALFFRNALRVLLIIILGTQFFFGKYWHWTDDGPRLLSGIIYYPYLLKKTWPVFKKHDPSQLIGIERGKDKIYLFRSYINAGKAFFIFTAGAVKRIDEPINLESIAPLAKTSAFLMPDGSRIIHVAYYFGECLLGVPEVLRVIAAGQSRGFSSIIIDPGIRSEMMGSFNRRYPDAVLDGDEDSGYFVRVPLSKFGAERVPLSKFGAERVPLSKFGAERGS
ncbi:MAG: hypothetical protein WC532_07495 [Candidatus Omnitrophota bacterium]